MAQYLSFLRNPAWDFALFFTILASGFFWGISGGKKKLAVFILALYALTAIFPYIPLDEFLKGRSQEEIWMFKAGTFLALLAILTLFLLRAFKGASFGGESYWWEIILMSLLASGFFVVSLLNLAPPEIFSKNIIYFSSFTKTLFLNPAIAKWWIAVPILGVLFF